MEHRKDSPEDSGTGVGGQERQDVRAGMERRPSRREGVSVCKDRRLLPLPLPRPPAPPGNCPPSQAWPSSTLGSPAGPHWRNDPPRRPLRPPPASARASRCDARCGGGSAWRGPAPTQRGLQPSLLSKVPPPARLRQPKPAPETRSRTQADDGSSLGRDCVRGAWRWASRCCCWNLNGHSACGDILL